MTSGNSGSGVTSGNSGNTESGGLNSPSLVAPEQLQPAARHQRIELMALAPAPPSGGRTPVPCTFRTKAIGTIAELFVTDNGALVAASELLEAELARNRTVWPAASARTLS